MNYDIVANETQPLTHEDLQRAIEMFASQVPPLPNIVLMSQNDFDYTMVVAKYYQGKQIIRRNHNAQNKSNRYRRTWIAPYFEIVDKNCLMQHGVKFMPYKPFSSYFPTIPSITPEAISLDLR